ncbi:6-carboxytetrahydropterin synthase QueD [Pararcticibacter amylolyticus]|uniref:6-carboxy-5,6,7,8-tetrahydropterin synthase n=1 Tax=Pararcticibacter amylolyticus TaxID=2173175 RepID=A0A2U2PJS3_9SPHI|nr:6-carboxytetrahydropterin synthase QueD [Pararcticibacter amylolyticus]PWG81653.1 6-carboxytetrahydropterin synthase QueD [Pararcticibacter amylolyticus]
MVIYKQFTFDSAHFLPNVPAGHRCGSMHGHTYKLTVFFEGDLDPVQGWVIDFNDIKKIISPLIDSVDHKLLNDIPGLENPTSEVMASWFWNKIKPEIPSLSRIELSETPSTGVIYEG